MVHRARRESDSSHKMVAVANTGVPPCQPQVPTSYQPESASIPACQCSTFLDPYPSPQAHWSRTVPAHSALAHYCRVCNTQLNSCKQARIHVTGKKHEKRLAYLKFSLETSEAVNNNYAGQFVNNNNSGPVQTAIPTVYAYPPPCGGYPQPAGPAYYFP